MAMTVQQLKEEYEEMLEAVQQCLEIIADEDIKIAGKVRKITALLEPWEAEEEE